MRGPDGEETGFEVGLVREEKVRAEVLEASGEEGRKGSEM